ncbi:hypothetical protein P9112_005949 [Eukaryota sp. TZLM1-RC]
MKYLFLLAAVLALTFASGHDHNDNNDNNNDFNGDEFCNSLRPCSYCKHWLHIPVCQHIDVPCGGHEFCESLDPGSYCKFWLDTPVCQGFDVPCGPHMPEMNDL